ncbi:MAG: MMPL family transporter [Pseudonocardiaceae bacterium]
MFAGFGRFAIRHRHWIVAGTLLFVVFGGFWGSGTFGQLAGGAGFDDPYSESARANEILTGPLGRNVADVVVMFTSDNRTVDDPAFEAAVTEAAGRVPGESVEWIETFWTTGSPDYVSADRRSTYIAMQLASDIEGENVTTYQESIKDRLGVDGFEVRYGGLIPVNDQVNERTAQDLLRAELVSIPILLVLLIIIFRSVIAASLPLIVGVVVAVGSLGVLRVIGMFADLSTFAINIVTLLGLGLAIDYALIVVNRFREELAAGRSVDLAVERTMGAAGRTVTFSGLAVAVTFLGLLIFPSRFLISMAYASVSVVLFAVLSGLLLLPALLRIAGHRINSLRMPLPRFGRRDAETIPIQEGRWYKTAHVIMRRPVAVTVGLSIILLALGSTLLSAQWGRPSDWVLPAGVDSRVVDDQLDTEFVRDPTSVVTAVIEMPGPADSPASIAALEGFAERLDRVAGVDSAALTATDANLARLTLGYSMDPQSDEAQAMVTGIRAETPPDGATALFTNYPVSLVDMLSMLDDRLPWLALYVMLVTFVVLFLAFGSIVIPLQSLLLNALSLAAAFGTIALIFQHGFLSGFFGFIPAGFMDANMPMLILVIAFGLAMDYQVFTLSRIREQYRATGDPIESVAVGVQQSARIISSAALLLVVVVGGFMLSSITFMMMMGVGLVIAVVVDATLVRGILVPSTMRLLGKWAWWAPAPMARWWQRWGIAEEQAEPQQRVSRSGGEAVRI